MDTNLLLDNQKNLSYVIDIRRPAILSFFFFI